MLEYIRYLIDKKFEFTMSIVDLDDFKSVNDKYGHAAGDYILENVAADLIKFVGDIGIVGRYGGDEFIIVVFGKYDYKSSYDYLTELFHSGDVFRKTHSISNGIEVYVTATIGCASYPGNANNYDELFNMVDKTLYRGKQKGRNCFIVYVHDKHKDLVIQKMHNDDIPTMMSRINSIFDSNTEYELKLMETTEYLIENLNLNNILLIDEENKLYDILNMKKYSDCALMNDVVFKNERAQIDYRPDVLKLSFGKDIKELGLASLLMTRLKFHENIYGYLIFALKRNGKVWETNEISALLYYSKMITLELATNGGNNK